MKGRQIEDEEKILKIQDGDEKIIHSGMITV
jgi:hypothetical protein